MYFSSIPVTDPLSNLNDQMANAARLLGRSKHRQSIFNFVYSGQKQTKTIEEIMRATGLTQVHVLTEGGKMAGFLLDKVPGGYKKKRELSSLYKKILTLACDKKKLESLATKISPKTNPTGLKITVSFPSEAKNATWISIDDIDSFSKVRGMNSNSREPLLEQQIKNGFKKIIKEAGSFKDWGGEKSDLYTTQIFMARKRIPAAIAFKGKGTKGKLVPAKMGFNGDQIQRLFEEPAQLFLIVYDGQIDSSIISEMQAFAIGKALSGKKVYFGIVDATDLGRLIVGYPDSFEVGK